MEIKAIASGSGGNCYIVQKNNNKMLLELGISWGKILPVIGFKSAQLDFAFASHSHGDHVYGLKNALKAGLDVWISAETAATLGVQDHHRVHILSPGVQKTKGNWTVLPFSVIHDVPCLGAIIAIEDERLLYMSDTAYSPVKFKGLTHIMVECNFANNILSDNIHNGSLPHVIAHRVRRNHMSLETLIKMLKANDLSECREIHLLHLSDSNSDEARMIKEVQQATGIPTYAC